ncbi:hypothetical protein M0811_09250 [Anaeramoeba ignava]|uniref:Uncharacterized protein n=1 Tax=Anaeramoeba ignava TaxID=1746090 RepID=A0A9Q0RA78_ANAIG|nr:hypothetical protein M0811_09250 [Anaeramoeba ignava]
MKKINEKIKNDIWSFGNNKITKLLTKETNENIEKKQINIFPTNIPLKSISQNDFGIVFLYHNGDSIKYSIDLENELEIKIPNIEKILMIGMNHDLVLRKNGEFYLHQQYKKGKYSSLSFKIVPFIDDEKDQFVSDIVCTPDLIYLLTQKNNVYRIDLDQQFHFHFSNAQNVQKLVLLKSNVEKIFTSHHSSSGFFLDLDGKLFAFGANDFGQLGVGYCCSNQEIKEIENIPKDKIIDIQLGKEHTIILVEENLQGRKIGSVYSSGNAKYNGFGKNEDVYQFSKLDSPLLDNENIIQIGVGCFHSILLSSSGKIFGFGNNQNGQLGIPNSTLQMVPIQIELPDLLFDISYYKISCGSSNTFIYSSFSDGIDDEMIFLFKRNDENVVFATVDNQKIYVPKKMLDYRLKNKESIEKIREIISKRSYKQSIEIIEMIMYGKEEIEDLELKKEIQKMLVEESIIETISRIKILESNKK